MKELCFGENHLILGGKIPVIHPIMTIFYNLALIIYWVPQMDQDWDIIGNTEKPRLSEPAYSLI